MNETQTDDDEELVWKLDVTSISGFALPCEPFHAPYQTLSPIHITIEQIDIEFSQTFDIHPFRYYSQVTLISRTMDQPSKKTGVKLLIQLNQLANIMISDHGEHGQRLRFKLIPHKRTSPVRLAMING